MVHGVNDDDCVLRHGVDAWVGGGVILKVVHSVAERHCKKGLGDL